MNYTASRYPLLGLLIFYICGIGLADALYFRIPSLELYGACGAILLLFVLLLAIFSRRNKIYGIVISALYLAIGIWNYSQTRSETSYEWPLEERLCEARVLSVPRARQRSTLCEAEVLAVRDSSVWHPVNRKVFVYMASCDEARNLQPGDVLCFRGRVRPPHNFSDSLSFDYARYVSLQGVAGTVYLPLESWIRVGEGTLSLRDHMARVRQRLVQNHLSPTFDGDALGLLSALTLGDKQALSTEVRTVYSNAGAAHVLALSGMHVGIICGVLSFLLGLFLRRHSLRWLRELFTIVLLWGFALLVGMPASVVRAVSMCTLYIIARWFSDGTTLPLHILMLTAFLMLLVHPLYLFDVGFQLSFMAMASILWLEPYLKRFIRKYDSRPIAAYFVGVMCMSFAAQLGTFPLVLYHFGSFPTYFLLTNLLVVPALFVVLALMSLWWFLALTGVPFAQSLGAFVQCFIEWVTRCLQCIGQCPGSVLYVGGYGGVALFFTYLLIFFLVLLFVKRWSRALPLALASFLGLLLSQLG